MSNPWMKTIIAFLILSPAGFSFAGEPAASAPKEAVYSYKGDQFRDPFIPLAGESIVLTARPTRSTENEKFNPSGLELKGIIKAPLGRWGVLRSISGEAYMVQNGKIYDSKRKAIDGYVGIVKEESLVVMGPNNQVTELKLKKSQTEKK